MTLADMVFALLPAIGLFFIVGISANWLEEAAQHYARRELKFDEENERLRAAYDAVNERAQQIEAEQDKRAERERSLLQLQNEHSNAMAEEIKLTDPRNITVFEHGIPTPNAVGYYAKAVGPANAYPFDGKGSGTSGVHGRRYARFLVWGTSQANADKMIKQWIGPQGQVLEFRPFTGKIKMTEI
ncbi:hypothetical protein [Ferrovibrio sp.]|uniref:hypothetical protein n=1 Tax=Ferrovibrio sp. TaxID=1917215 RepID=UPI003D0B0ACF